MLSLRADTHPQSTSFCLCTQYRQMLQSGPDLDTQYSSLPVVPQSHPKQHTHLITTGLETSSVQSLSPRAAPHADLCSVTKAVASAGGVEPCIERTKTGTLLVLKVAIVPAAPGFLWFNGQVLVVLMARTLLKRDWPRCHGYSISGVHTKHTSHISLSRKGQRAHF